MPLSTGTHGGGQQVGEPLGGGVAENNVSELRKIKTAANMNLKFLIKLINVQKIPNSNKNILEKSIFVNLK